MFGEGISIVDLMGLLNAIRSKELVLHIKILDGEWRELSKQVFQDMTNTIVTGKITQASDIRLRLMTKPSVTATCTR